MIEKKRGRPKKIQVQESPVSTDLQDSQAIQDLHPDHAWQRACVGGGYLVCPVCQEVIPQTF